MSHIVDIALFVFLFFYHSVVFLTNKRVHFISRSDQCDHGAGRKLSNVSRFSGAPSPTRLLFALFAFLHTVTLGLQGTIESRKVSHHRLPVMTVWRGVSVKKLDHGPTLCSVQGAE